LTTPEIFTLPTAFDEVTAQYRFAGASSIPEYRRQGGHCDGAWWRPTTSDEIYNAHDLSDSDDPIC
jgi:hypothetical protein